MDVKNLVVKDKGMKGRFLLEGSYSTFANALRRTIISDIPAMAIDRVRVYENSSFVYDEMIAKRLGLLPLTTDLKTYSFRDDCKCGAKGCGRCEVNLILEKAGPGMVYASDIKSQDPKVKPIYEKMPLLKLAAGQKVKLEMVASLGTTKKHAKYQSALASFKANNDDTDFDFFVESYGERTVNEIVAEATDILEAKFADFLTAFEDAKKPKKAAKTTVKKAAKTTTKKKKEEKKKEGK